MRTPILPLIGLAVLLAIGLVHCTAAWGQFLPPEEFDKPYDGSIVFHLARDQDEVRRICKAAFKIGKAAGCAQVFGDMCLITKLPNFELRELGIDPDIFMRHEIGHCNGWPASHKGAR